MNINDKESVGRWISLLHRYGNVYINEQLKEFNIGAGQYQFLAVLYENEGASQDEIASILKVDKGTTARAIAKLEKEGYVERKVFTVDKRIKKLYLTDKAYTFEAKLTEILLGWKNILVEDLSTEEQEYVLKLFKKMAGNAEVSLAKIK
ncbi:MULTISPECIES: MarR family winged helix-turn-helix transcriptional regulator [Bacillus]|uniref:MarR family transcriptional regulator n=1 Tax=Bacillus cereus TaxID=1396 RepID=A0A2A8IT99_BACCE|nr:MULTISPECIES: MarR family transcriptional regulator [Bacillus]MDH4424581.1 MarR family transcriptional regulator [Bacillus cereus]PER22705.1 MarR family transcriptional regulator [Bacillus cereus]PFA62644.1 MarR family transcriptional regulator [Bacillus sp. AFS015896]PGL82725.1 MarR family transcriptional regulator [Bacillus sp. AFS054943]PGU02455.1 MarR family transcriptional regulator [Bacillus cereus]